MSRGPAVPGRTGPPPHKRVDLHLLLMTPADWQPLVKATFADAAPRLQRMGEALLRNMHDRHLGCTPGLALDLARVMVDARRYLTKDNGWYGVCRRLATAIAAPAEQGGSPVRMGALFAAAPVFAIQRIAMPLVEAACRQVGQSILFADDPVPRQVATGRYHNYVKNLQSALDSLSGKPHGPLRLFWRERALSLAADTREGTHPQQRLVPQINRLGLALLNDLPLSTVEQKKAVPRRANLRKPAPYSQADQRRESGVDGIRVSRRDEDLNNILLSEFVNPSVLLADRLANTGFLALRRQPKRESLRRVMVTGAMPFADMGPMTAVVKRIWFEAACLLAHRLCNAGLRASVFRWFEGGAPTRLRAHTHRLHQMPHRGEERPLDAGFRHAFLTSMDWVQTFFQNEPGELLTHTQQPDIHFEMDTTAHWLRAVVGRIHPSASVASRLSPSRKSKPDHYDALHCNVFLPYSLHEAGHPWDQRAVNALRRLFHWQGKRGHHLAIVWYPDHLEQTQSWHWQEKHLRELLPDGPSDLSEWAGRLATDWHQQWTRGIWRG